MHYYQKNIGDYGRDTGHLSALEHGVYNLLIDWYYLNERPITMKEAIRVSRGNPDETQVVLSEFFKETKQGWIHSYADRIIAEYHAKAERNRVNGAKGGRPAKESQPIDSKEYKTQVVTSGMPELTLTNNHKPLTNTTEKLKSTVQPMAARSRFAEFWAVYPNKKCKKEAEKRWVKDRLDFMADSIIAHVEMMKAQDDGWQRGYAPMGSTYLNQARWTDEPQAAPRASQPQQAPSKAMQTIIGLEASKRERLDSNGNRDGVPAANLPWTRAAAGNGPDGRHGNGLGNGSVSQPSLGSGFGRPALQGRVLDHDGD